MIRHHLISEQETYGARLNAFLENCSYAFIATAFLTRSALKSVDIEPALERGARITFLIGRYEYVTEPKAIYYLLMLSKKYPKLKVYFDSAYNFHFKVALFKYPDGNAIIIGSSNLTAKGLSSQGEHNLEITDHISLFSRHRSMLEARLDFRQEAAKQISEYATKYKMHKKLRGIRSRAAIAGAIKWHQTSKRVVSSVDGNSFPFLVVDEYEKDKILINNIQKERKSTSRTGINLPGRWISSESKKDMTIYQKDVVFVLCDVTSKSIGFARCLGKIFPKNEKGLEKPVIFYRFIRNWKITKKNVTKFHNLLSKLRISTNRERPVGVKFKQRFSKLTHA